MNILFLGGNLAKELADWLLSIGENVTYIEEKINLDFVEKLDPEFIISYNYRFIIPKEIIDFVQENIINLHISYLPWNKGAHPNSWSFLEDNPKGITIHYIDEGIDTGDIIIQKEMSFNEGKETLKSSYKKLHQEIQRLFKINWAKIKKGEIEPKKQKGKGNIHFKRDYGFFEPIIKEKGWDITIREFKEKYMILKR